jgi:catechol 2,3-dioxygenase-like lactoylglutathione lyase family enzyme
MITALDHIVLITPDIEAGVGAYQTLFGVQPAWRTRGDGAATAMFTFANTSLELIAPDGDSAGAERVRAALAKDGEGLASLAVRVDDLLRTHRRLERVGLQPAAIADGHSTNALDGATLSWQRTRTATEATNGVRMFALELHGERPRSQATGGAPITGLDHVVIATAHPDRAMALYGAKLGLDMIRDLARPDWNARLMFFRCGDLIFEVMQRLDRPVSDKPDRLWGLSWRVADADTARERLASSGLDVSEVRTGRLPGTRVFTARNGTCGVPTLLVEPQQRR